MNKSIQLKLLKIKYSGDSVGDDIHIEIEHPLGVLFLDKQIKNKNEVSVEKIIYQSAITQNISNIPLNVKITEKDLVFNDFGGIKVDLTVDLNNTKPQISNHEIIVKELRGVTPGSKKAIFVVTLEALVFENIYYVPLTDDGWLVCNKGGIGEQISLPSFTKVHFDKIESNKEYFTVMEGKLLGMQLWSNKDRERQFLFLKENPQTDVANLIYSISKKALKLDNKTYLTIDSPNAQWKKGLYDIEIPDYPHEGGLYYEESKFARVWFRIGHKGDRYLHTGSHSLGCMTVIEIKKWDEIFEILIRARKRDNKSIGILKVVN